MSLSNIHLWLFKFIRIWELNALFFDLGNSSLKRLVLVFLHSFFPENQKITKRLFELITELIDVYAYNQNGLDFWISKNVSNP